MTGKGKRPQDAASRLLSALVVAVIVLFLVWACVALVGCIARALGAF